MVMNGNNDSKDDTDNHGVHLSQDIIIYDILTRIPGKDLNRFRCVSKLWSNLFNDPLFISLYRTRAMSRTPTGFISLERSYHIPLVGHDNTTYNFVFFDIDNKEEKITPFRLPEKETFGVSVCDSWIYYIQDSFNGLLLVTFSAVGKYEYFIYNLVTASWLYMGTSTPSQRLNHYNASLAYDPIISKYKVVGCSDDNKLNILSDKLWSCVSMPERLNGYMIDGFCKPVFVIYDLHWICRKKGCVSSNNLKEDSLKLLRLDVSTKKMSTTNLPVKDLNCSTGYLGLLEMEGLLWFFHSASDYHSVQLWYLKKKKKKRNNYCGDEWVMMCNVNLMTEISLQQLKKSTSISAESRSSAVTLKYNHWTNCPILFVMDPKCKIVFTYLCIEDSHKYVCSYDIESKQGNLIYARQTNQKVLYWHGNF